ncbi:hypothetical protein N7495_006681 [Penicillium taxi]|uniref:uncharacterized protein n=1 Tax=Penicillium taxi TaxID=168475 RepID=UPI0025455E6A|nr:uncharacterized protein N7495_006681 [Penicillium taxi]KAJ5894990.1 hypothetical protein N7495_006681 [Penicillium taxi]
MSNSRQASNEPIAIVGSACRFPGDAVSSSKLWDLLKEPRDVLTEIPSNRFNPDAFYHPDGSHHGTSNVRHSYVLSDDYRLFDAQFFGTMPVEAKSIDPQQRLLLETVYEGLEVAGIPMEQLQGSNTGVYVGLMTNDYAELVGRDIQSFPTYFASGAARSILSNRISYFFDWHGPSMTIDTACSASLVALHQAVLGLRSGESNMAVAAGTNLLLGPEQYIAESKLKMLSPHGRSRMWDKDANGYARGEGIAAVVLKPLSVALADGDHIECIIRETGINQDGRTKGITMPNPMAQADLIRQTYAKAGLDLSKPSDRPQYFEAHGTGTPAGDPVEAEAISKAFFGSKANYYRKDDQESPLYVGSIKTVIGHTEGTAGIAAVMKASLALQHGVIPPNLLLNELNPNVRPFYNDLQIVTAAQGWPTLPSKGIRRASVNSFGFGGANAHAILESFEPSTVTDKKLDSGASVFTPFNFSASSGKSLVATLQTYSNYLKGKHVPELRDLSWTLNCRRSTLPARFSVAALDLTDFITQLEKAVESPAEILSATQATSIKTPKLLGIFTGQGAQWAGMGAELLNQSPMAAECITRLDSALQKLPLDHRPQWSLKEEIMKDAAASRIGEALFSQSLCTAVQIMLVDHLRAAGVVFNSVVGHSSGEIAAAYASGYVCAEDAMKIAYYRGWSLQFAGDNGGVKGAMMAVGTSLEDAKELCEMASLEGRICVAASNSSASVTLSGDADAVEEAKEIFEDEKKFARLLKVDKAYHSHHMLPCSAPYIEAIQKCGIKILKPTNAHPTWISSVYGKEIESVNDNLGDTYWSNNMVNPVLFSQAVSFAIGVGGPFDMAVEVGPHPALKGPALQTIQEISGLTLPYSGTLSRGQDARKSFASTLGALWVSLGEQVVDFAGLQSKVTPNAPPPKLLKDLPSYSWDHDRLHWHESRISAEFRGGNQKFHQLLGMKEDSTQKEIRWRNILHTREISWLSHHQVQGQMVFPAAGYISAAVEMVLEEYGLESIQLIDFEDAIVGQALVLEDSSEVEIVFTLTIVESQGETLRALFNCYSDSNKGSSSMSLHASSHLKIVLGGAAQESLPLPYSSNNRDQFLDLDEDRFYNTVLGLGFGYTGPFRALSGLSRKMDEATGMIAVPDREDGEKPLLIHPGSLDGAIQSIMLAYCFPGDGRMRTLYLPTKIDRIRINPRGCMDLAGPGSSLPFYSSVADARFSELSGDVDIYSSDGKSTVVQLQGLHTTPLTPLTPADDVLMFTELTWNSEEPVGNYGKTRPNLLPEDCSLSLSLDRVAHFYLKELDSSFTSTEKSVVQWHHAHFLSYAASCASLVKSGEHPFGNSQWANDTVEDISKIFAENPDNIDLKIIRTVGENINAVIRGEGNLLEILMTDNLLSQFYARTLGIQSYLEEAGHIASQLSHRFPHMNVLEIGAGAGEATEYILRGMGTAFSSYSFTDIVDSQFEPAQERFKQHQNKMAFKTLDIEKDITEQEYTGETFDLVVASLALYATKSLEATLSNVRRMIKPGGYLLLLEITDSSAIRFGLVLGGLPAWWLGHPEGRTMSPSVSVDKWSELMQKAGFAGVDTVVPHNPEFPVPFSVMLAQAVNNQVTFLRNPLAADQQTLDVERLAIIGGTTPLTANLVSGIKKSIAPHYTQVSVFPSLADVIPDELPAMGTVLCLADLEGPTFVSLTPEKLKFFQELFKKSKSFLWVGHGAQGDNPFSHMFVGIQRTLVTEMIHLRIQFLNLDSLDEANGDLISAKLLNLEAADLWEQKGQMKNILWYTERELWLKDGKFLIPRLKLNSERNDRYNSSRRLIVKNVDRKDSIVTLRRSENSYQILETNIPSSLALANQAEIQAHSSLLRAVKITEVDRLFLIAGNDAKTGEDVIALSETLDSCTHVPSGWVVRCGHSKGEATKTMINLYTHFLVQSLFRGIQPGSKIGVLDPEFSIAAVLAQQGSRLGIQMVFFTTQQSKLPGPSIYVHHHATRRELASKIPRNIARLFSAGSGDDTLLSLLKSLLPADCQVETEQTLTMEGSYLSNLSHVDQVTSQLQRLWIQAHADDLPVNNHRLQSLSLRDLIENYPQPTQQSLVVWGEEALPTQVCPATKVVQFSKNKTYWLVGLTAGLGLSLCQWMVRQGARYIALSSRNPKVDQSCIENMARDGCTIRVFSCDITDRDSVHKAYSQITDCMPPIGGVAQGAMVLQDTMFFDLDLPRFEKVLRPKVQGSILLDELFSKNTLDFMIFFSSMAAVTGNPGQVAYNAANMFMASLAAQRQKRGLPTHAINIGAIVGNGYVTRELNMGQQSYLYRVGHTWMSEQDFHEVFAEGVLSCLKGSSSHDLCSGLRIDDDDTKNWVTNPIFQHLVIKADASVTIDKKGKAGAPVRLRLLECTSMDDVMEVLQDGFLLKLQAAIQIDPTQADSILASSPDDLGIDSLRAVDLRSWFLKELSVDVPVLKIFNSASIQDLLSFSAGLLPEASIPMINGDGEAQPKVSEPNQSDGSTETNTSNFHTPMNGSTSSEIGVEPKGFNLEYLPSHANGGGSSSDSLNAGDSSSEPNDVSSSSSVDDDSEPTQKNEIQKRVPMSFSQSRFWFLKLFVPNQTTFNVTALYELSGKFRLEDFTRAFDFVAQRHESLRTFFYSDNDQQPMQGIWAKSRLRLEHQAINDKKAVDVAVEEMKKHVFNISDGETVRVQLLSLSPDKNYIITAFHHINMDGISFDIFWSDVDKAYRGETLPSGILQYPEFTLRQMNEYQGGSWSKSLAYWREQFVQIPPVIPLLPFARRAIRPNISSFGSDYASIEFDTSIINDIDNCCRLFKVTPFHFHLTVWKILLLRQLDIESICIGLSDANRTDADILQSIGLFLNALPIQMHRQSTQSFSESVKETKNVAQQAFQNSRVPFDVILTELNVPRSAAHNPMFQIFYNYRRVEEFRNLCGCEAKGSLLTLSETSYDLHLDIVEFGGGKVSAYIFAQKDLYGQEHAEILLRSYCHLVKAFTQNPATRVEWPPMFTKDDVEEGLMAGRGSEMEDQWPQTVVHRVDDILSTHSDHIALKNENETFKMSYVDLQRRVAFISNELSRKGVDIGSRVAVFQSPSTDWICSILAIWRAGGTYVAMDKKVGLDRLVMIASRSEPTVVIVDSSTAPEFPQLHTSALPLNISTLSASKIESAPNLATANQVAAIMFTSGSTGIPKGVPITHAGLSHHIQAFSHTLGIEERKETILHQASYAWDLSLYQILLSLCNCETLIVANSQTRGDPIAISELIEKQNVTMTFATPTEYLAWTRNGRTNLQNSVLKTALCGGETLPNGLIRDFQSLKKSDLKLFNVYGPAESTFACAMAEVDYTDIDTISGNNTLTLRTLPNYSVYIVDENLNPVPLEMPGEVIIGGAGTVKGYLNDEKSKERFMPDQYASSFFQSREWTTAHRSGELGRLTKNGDLVLLGRIDGDNQVKIGGIRVNVEEIEEVIVRTSSGRISQAVVSPRSANEQTFFIAFVTLADSDVTDESRRFLEDFSRELPVPQYMRPAAMIHIDSIPQNSSGKVDRRAVNDLSLPQNAAEHTDNNHLAPLEETLEKLWKAAIPDDLSSLYSIHSDSDFFHVGGSSISLVSLQALIKNSLGVSVPLYQLFEASTLKGMAHRIQNLFSADAGTAVNWNEEIETLLGSSTSLNIDSSIAPSKASVIVLTGATGFIGREVLQNLIDDEKTQTIYCLAVRKPVAQLPAIFTNPKVHVYSGNLGTARLGLSESDAVSIFNQADVVIHNGADVSFMKSYQSLKLTNVASTKELMTLALPRKIPFHFISSAGVTRLAKQESFGESSLASYPPPDITDDGYTASKWVCEVYLEQASERFGVPVWIHRPSSTTGANAPELDLMSNIMRYCQKTKKIPDSNSWTGVFDLISVQSVATQIIEAVHLSGGSEGEKASVQFRHESGETQLGHLEVQSMLENETNQHFEMVSVSEWVNEAERMGMSPLLGLYLRKASGGQILFPKLLKGQ